MRRFLLGVIVGVCATYAWLVATLVREVDGKRA